MNWFVTIPATLSVLPGEAIKVTIPTTLQWTPGQHVFLRFPKLAPFDNHPFSITSVPSQNTKEYEERVLEFVIKPYSGFTQRLMSFVKANPDANAGVVMDGPYGGVPRAIGSFNTVVLIAGGSGITAVVGFLMQLAGSMKHENVKVCTEKIKLVWVVKNQEVHGWFRQEIMDAIEGLPEDTVECRFHVTGAVTQEGSSPEASLGKEVGITTTNSGGDAEGIIRGRPDCDALLSGWVPQMGLRACVLGKCFQFHTMVQ